jgi:hypothetical protein
MKKSSIIIASVSGALALVATGMAIKKAKDKKSSGGDTDIDETEVKPQENGSGGGTTLNTWGVGCTNARDTSAYGLKVMQVQKNIGFTNCDVDGLVGPMTNGALQKKYPELYKTHGNLSPSNIDVYLAGSPLRVKIQDYAKSVVNQVNTQSKTAVVKKDGNNVAVAAFQMVKPPNEDKYIRSTLMTRIKVGSRFKNIFQDGEFIVVEPQPSDIWMGSPYYSTVRILATHLIVE